MGNTRRFPRTLARAQREQLGVRLRVEPASLAYLTHLGERACGACGFHVCSCPKPSSKPRDYLGELLGGDAWQRLVEAASGSIEHTVFGFGPRNRCAQAGCEVCDRAAVTAVGASEFAKGLQTRVVHVQRETGICMYYLHTESPLPSQGSAVYMRYDGRASAFAVTESVRVGPCIRALSFDSEREANEDFQRRYDRSEPEPLVVDGIELPPGWFYDEDSNEWVSEDERRWISVGDDGGYDANVDDEIDMGPGWGGDVEAVYGVLDAVMACYGFDRVNKWYHAVVGGIEVAVWPGAGNEWIADNDHERRMYDSPWPAVAFALGKTPQELYGA